MGRNNADFEESALYHGTSHPFEVGDIVEPRMLGKAWATNSYETASRYGRQGVTRVFRVEPLVTGEPTSNSVGGKRYISSEWGFRVLGEVDEEGNDKSWKEGWE